MWNYFFYREEKQQGNENLLERENSRGNMFKAFPMISFLMRSVIHLLLIYDNLR